MSPLQIIEQSEATSIESTREKLSGIDNEMPATHESASLLFAGNISHVFDRLYTARESEVQELIDEAAVKGLLPQELAETLKFVNESVNYVRSRFKAETNGANVIPKSLINKCFGGIYHYNYSSFDLNAVSVYNPFAVELAVGRHAVGSFYYGRDISSEYCSIPAGLATHFITGVRVDSSEEPAEIPLIVYQRRVQKTTIPAHERFHVNFHLLEWSELLPNTPNYWKALEAAEKIVALSAWGSDEDVFASKEWVVLQKYADYNLVNEVLARWAQAIEDPDFDIVSAVSGVIKVDNFFYNFFTKHLGIREENTEDFRFIWNTYAQRAAYNIQPALTLLKYYRQIGVESRIKILGTALCFVPLESWRDYLEGEGLLDEYSALRELETVLKDVPETHVTVRGSKYDTDEIYLAGSAEYDKILSQLKSNPELILTNYVRNQTSSLASGKLRN